MRLHYVLSLIIAIPAWLCSRAGTTVTVPLSGMGDNDAVLWDFKCSDGMNSGRWKKIHVPSCWEQEGFGTYTYGRYYHDRPGSAPADETGTYRTTFNLPAKWQGQRVELVFEGVMTDAAVTVNGKSAGPVHKGGFTQFTYDITPLVRWGRKNTLEVEVAKESSDASINGAERKADWWLFGGIYRPVYLQMSPMTRIRRVALDPRHDGTLTLDLLTDKMTSGSRLRVTCAGQTRETTLCEADSQRITLKFDNIRPWHPETPQLYDLKFELTAPDGTVAHTMTERTGFRTVEFRERDGFYLNGRKIRVKGVNRHCFYPETGRTGSRERDIEDVKLIKGMNANAIRSHYPPDSHLLDICDSLGVLYLNELPGWQTPYSTAEGGRILREMVTRDVNHPCIFAWSNGNEGGFNYDLEPMFGAYDPQGRHVVYAWANRGGVDAHHYPAYQTGVARLGNGYEVFMPTEFLHAQYDKGAGTSLDGFWSNWSQNPRFAGGFIWSWADEGIERRDRGGAIDTDGPNGPDGIVGPYREKEASWYTIRDVWSPVTIDPVAVTPNFDGTLAIGNGYLSKSLGDIRMDWRIVSVPTPAEGNAVRTVASGSCNLPAIMPGEKSNVSLGLTSMPKDADLLCLAAIDAHGDTINTWSMPARYADQYVMAHRLPTATGRAIATDSTLSANGLTVTFDTRTGQIASIEINGKRIPFRDGPVPVGMKAELISMSGRADGDDAVIVARYRGAIDSIEWRMTPAGLLGMDAVMLNDRRGHGYKGKFFDDEARSFGLTFSYPEEEATGFRWMGRGPYRVWRNRQRGMNVGLWHKDYNNTVTGESARHLVYPEFKGYHANTYWGTVESDSAPFTVYSETDGLYMRLFTPAEPAARRDGKDTMMPFPEGDISFLLEIPPMQSYKPVGQLGPQAQAPNIRLNPGDKGLRIKLTFDFLNRK